VAMSGKSEFEDVLDAAWMRQPRYERKVGPFTYSRDEYRSWHNISVGDWEFSLLPDRNAPCFNVHHRIFNGLQLRVEADYQLPAWADRALNRLEGHGN